MRTVAVLASAFLVASSGSAVAEDIPPDTTAPTATGHYPASSEEGVVVSSNVTVDFSEPLDPDSVDGLSMYVLDGSMRVPAVVSLSEVGTQMVLEPSNDLRPDARYRARVVGGEGAVTDLAGNELQEPVRWTFFTNAAPKIAVHQPPPGSITRDRTPTIGFKASDREGRIPKARVQVTLNGESQEFHYMRRRGDGWFTPQLKRGTHTVVVTATDAVGVSKSRTWSFQIGRG